MTTYEVRFTIHHYQSGYINHLQREKTFTNLQEAKECKEKLIDMIYNGTYGGFVLKYCNGGVLNSVDGIYELTERKVD